MDRTRRLRQTVALRNMVRENHVRVDELIYPLFVMEGENLAEPVESMPGICQYSLDRMMLDCHVLHIRRRICHLGLLYH